jgi:hypothetical protein
MRQFAVLFLLVVAAWAANIKLYLKDGTFHVVREYQVQSDRVHFYSVERDEWEDIPLDLVDLKKTEAESTARKAQLEHDSKVVAEEEAAERAVQKEASRIPQAPGVYWLEGTQTKAIKAAESVVHSDKRREILKMLSPIPAISGKATLEIDGAHSQNVFSDPEQELFIQLSETERFGICKLTTKNGIRIVANLTYHPITKDVTEEPTMVDVFRQEMAPGGLYKIWAKEKLEAGEYAVIEYTEGKMNIQVWDFAIKPR